MFASRVLRPQKLYGGDEPPGAPYLDCIAVVLTRGSSVFVVIGVYIPAGAAMWAHAWDHINRLTSAIRAGRYGKETARARIVVMGDLNAALGTDARPFIPGWTSLEQTPVAPDHRGVDLGPILGAQIAVNDLVPANSLLGPAAITFERLDRTGRYTASVLDIILIQSDLVPFVAAVDVIGDQAAPHSLDAIVNGGDGHRLVQTRLEFPTAPARRRIKPPVPPPPPHTAYASTTFGQRANYRELLHAEYDVINAEYLSANEERADNGPDGALDMERMTDVLRRSAERAYAAAGIAALRTESMSRLLFKRVKSCKRHFDAARKAHDTATAFTAYTAWRRAQSDLRKSLREQTSRD